MNVRTASWGTVIGVLLIVCALPMVGTANASTGDDHKVVICHVPPGNPENAQSIEVDRESWSGHRNHRDDYEGPCQTPTTTTTVGTTTSEVTTTSTSSVPDTTTSTSTVVDTTTTTTTATTTSTSVPPVSTTIATPTSTTITVAPTTTTQPPASVLPETTIREQPGPDIDYPATAERVPASGYRGEELALTGTRYDVKPLLVSSLLFVLLGLLLAWCPWCKKNGKD